MAVIQLEEAITPPVVLQQESTRVQVRTKWGDEWEDLPYLVATSASETAAPGVSRASLLYRFGDMHRQDLSGFSFFKPQDLVNKFVRIVRTAVVVSADGEKLLESVPLWYGIIDSQAIDLHANAAATLDDNNEAQESGDQLITAFGLEHLLDRYFIEGSFKISRSKVVHINWAPPFNEQFKWGESEIGNRSTGFRNGAISGASHVYSFDRDVWTNLDIAEYLLANYGTADIPFVLGGQIDDLDKLITPRLNLEGVSIRNAFNHLIPPSRGFGWVIRVDEEDNIIVHIYTVFGENISVNNKTVTANREQWELDADAAIDVSQLILTDDGSARFDSVFVRGALIKSMFTVSFADGTLVSGWSGIEELDYIIGAGSTDGRTNDLARASDKLGRVFARFVIPESWDWQAGDGEGGPLRAVLPGLANDGSFSEGVASILSSNDVQLMRNLLLEFEGGNEIEPEFRTPLVLLQDPETDLFVAVEKMGALNLPSCIVRPLDNGLGLEVRAGTNHELALNHFAGGGASQIEERLDYTTMVATVAAVTDGRLQISEQINEGADADLRRVLVVEVPDAERWFLIKGTVTDVKDGALVKHRGNIVLRDDVDRLREIAALAKSWYGRRRQRVDLILNALDVIGQIGSFITKSTRALERNEAGTVVTSRFYDFEAQTTQIITDFANLDLAAR